VTGLHCYVESGVGMAFDAGAAAWTFGLDHWGVCGQGRDEESAIVALRRALATDRQLTVAERIRGDERAFERDREAATEQERQVTLRILGEQRPQTLQLLGSCPPEVLDFDDLTRQLPAFAKWRTLRQMLWHIADTESRYYLPGLNLPQREAAADLVTELRMSAEHVQTVLTSMPLNTVVEGDGQVWTSRKLLRRLAWHERSELVAMRAMLTKQQPIN
jgi:hypothetical protein